MKINNYAIALGSTNNANNPTALILNNGTRPTQ